jgi:hemerythrin-like domain-containing protein
VAFLMRYADDMHHAKEEGILFREMHNGGMPKEGGPLHCMTVEHNTLRKLAELMVASLADLRAGRDEASDVLIEAADGYVRVLSAHIQREDLVLYPLATRVIVPEVFAKMEAEFAQVDAGFSVPMELAANELEALVWPPASFQGAPEHVRLTPG